MMQQSEPSFPCPKCDKQFPMSQMHSHYQTCQGKSVQQQQSAFPQTPQYQAPPQLYIPPPVPEHKHQWFENDTYKVCVTSLYNPTDTSCKQIKLKLRGSWMIFVRYGFKLFWIQLIVALAIAFSLTSAFGVHH